MRLSKYAPATGCAIALLALAWLFTDKGRARHAVFELERVTDASALYAAPGTSESLYRPDAPAALAPYRDAAQLLAGDGPTLARASRLLEAVARLGSEQGLKALQLRPPIREDDPHTVYRSLRDGTRSGNCAHYAWTYQVLSQAAGIAARVVGMEGDVWVDGKGHALNEVFLPESGAWVIMDPQNNATFHSNGSPLSLVDLRTLLRAGRGDAVDVVQGAFRTGMKDRGETLAYYGHHIDRLVFDNNTALLHSYRDIYDSPLARALFMERWPRPARRLAENVFWQKDSRGLFVDGEDVDFFFVEPWIFWGAVALLAVSLCGLVFVAIRRKQTQLTPDASKSTSENS